MKTMSELKTQISERARQLWESAGRPEGRDDEFWLAAEAELKATAAKPATPQAAKPKPGAKSKAAKSKA
jgi:hypothetical protein